LERSRVLRLRGGATQGGGDFNGHNFLLKDYNHLKVRVFSISIQ
tara:strand:- start:318 stop:449 length:132 start_codon:yes stop_codon:yes gene_type:complete